MQKQINIAADELEVTNRRWKARKSIEQSDGQRIQLFCEERLVKTLGNRESVCVDQTGYLIGSRGIQSLSRGATLKM